MLEFAQNSLGYALGNIVLHGWSIGGYATSWAAMNHPGIRGPSICPHFESIWEMLSRILVTIMTFHLRIPLAPQLYAGVLLDAPFDDLAPLAERIVPSMLPTYFLPFTEVVLRRHYNLDVAAQLSGAPVVACHRTRLCCQSMAAASECLDFPLCSKLMVDSAMV